MDNKKRKKYDRIAKITGILAGLILVLGTSYAVFRTVTTGEQDSVISAGKLDVRIENEQDEITLENAFPITEEEGKKQTPYTFDVVNEGTINAEYDLYIEIDESVSTLPVDVVRYYLTVEEDGTEKIVTSSSRTISQEEVIEKEGKKLYKIDNKYLDTEKSNHYKLYLWVDYNATTEQATNKTFEAKVSIEAVQIYDENRLVQQIDVSANGDGSINAYMYANGNVVIKGQGQLKDDLSDTLVYTNEEFIDIYKKVFIAAGAPAEDVKSFTSLQEFQDYLMNLQEEDPELYQSITSQDMDTLLQLVVMQDVLEDLGYDTNGVELTTDAYMAYLVEQGLMDEGGQFTEKGQEFYTKFQETGNSLNNPTIPAKSIVLDEGITNIPNGLFTGNESITEVQIPSTVTIIGDNAFFGCTGLRELELPNGVTSVGNNAFHNCTSLQSITLPNNVTSIGASAFYSCTSLQSITLSNNVTSIGHSTFYNCTSLTMIEMPDGVTSIGSSAFYNCKNLSSAKLSVNLTSIGTYAFQGCASLASVTVPDGVTNLGWAVFSGCTDLTHLSIPGTMAFTNTSFSGVNNLEVLKITGIGEFDVESYSNTPWYNSGNTLKKVIICDGITTIYDYAFSNCTALTYLSIPGTTKFSNNSFKNVSNLETVEITGSGAMPDYSSNTYISYIYTPWYISRNNIKKVIIHKGITSIGFATFMDSGITSIELPDGITSIGSQAFMGSHLSSVKLPDSITNIGSNAFSATDLRSIELPDGITSIEKSTFSQCTNLTSIKIPNSVISIGDFAFLDCTGLNSITIPNSVTSIGTSTFEGCTNLQSITLSKNLTTMGDFAFRDCTGLNSITIPNSVVEVGSVVFNRWKSTQTINIDNTEAYVTANWDSNWNNNCSATINYLRT